MRNEGQEPTGDGPERLVAVGRWYGDFRQLTDRDVELALARVPVSSR